MAAFKFRVFYTNFDYFAQYTFSSYDEAIAYGKSKGFEFCVYLGSELVGSWSPIGGHKDRRTA